MKLSKAIIVLITVALNHCPLFKCDAEIDRRALAQRHNIVITNFDTESPLTVGNGNFSFTVDVTGLQTFPSLYEKTIPLGTLSQWGWHSFPNPNNWSMSTFKFTAFDSHGRKVEYPDVPNNIRTPEINYLRDNPHRLHLGRIGLTFADNDEEISSNDLKEIRQTLNLWSGIIHSRFTYSNSVIEVETFCHPQRDMICVKIHSEPPLERQGILIAFPYGTADFKTADWTKPDAHITFLDTNTANVIKFFRRVDEEQYQVATTSTPQSLALPLKKKHHFILKPVVKTNTYQVLIEFGQDGASSDQPSYEQAKEETERYWNKFWMSGGAIDLSESKDSRWKELERRIVLSEYLTAIQCSGIYPPAESGLTFNSWAGKFHLEMHWWHSAHFILWNRAELFERSFEWYNKILPQARQIAKRQGYLGARFPKMTSPSGIESPSPVGPFLIWQQPHPIYYAELLYQHNPSRKTLEKYYNIVKETADFMASYATRDDSSKRYLLGPPLQCAQERFPKETTFNPTFELTYWRWGLITAQKWRERLGFPLDTNWEEVIKNLSLPAVSNALYLFAESAPDSYTNPRYRTDHPAVLAAYGFLPGVGIDKNIMDNTFLWIWKNWNWKETWGWDYPLVAMCAARLGKPDLAIEALLMNTAKNQFGKNGHNYQRPNLPIYLPGNGGLLAAIAMMSAGWEGAPSTNAPGFPKNGLWKVKYESLNPLP
ncbi:MAG: glycoside hydrolase family 65 [Verrucomicrobiia bacterium]